ncbi:peptidase S51 [Shewanella sp. OPT22]|nr:peptidase S51 [Shewanella sp. OPT22]
MQLINARKGVLVLLSQHDSENGRLAIQQALGKHSKKIGYVASQPDPERTYYKATQDFYKQLGFEMDTYIELESEFDPNSLELLLNNDAIHLSGGDTFRFLEFVKERKLEKLLVEYYLSGGGLIGVSAGAMILTPSIESAQLCADINSRELKDLKGLSLTDFTVIPHVEDKFSLIEQGKVPSNCYLMNDNDALLLFSNAKPMTLGDPILRK